MRSIVPENPVVSVIMPVYNTGELLRKTIECILAQTFQDFELLLVDDGSTDCSASICDAYQAADPRVTVFHKTNGGICSARNVGLEQAKGQYIAFCDHDDILLPECLEKCVRALQETGADLVRFRRGHELRTERGVRYNETQIPHARVFERINWHDYTQLIRSAGFGVWAGVYKSQLLSDAHIRFREEVRYGYEDHIFTSECCAAAEKAVLLPETLYIWVQREHVSTSMKVGEDVYANHMDSILLWLRTEEEISRRFGVPPEAYAPRKLLFLGFAMAEVDRLDCTAREKRRAYLDFQSKVRLDPGKCKAQAGTLREKIKAWYLCRGAVRTYHFFQCLKRTRLFGYADHRQRMA